MDLFLRDDCHARLLHVYRPGIILFQIIVDCLTSFYRVFLRLHEICKDCVRVFHTSTQEKFVNGLVYSINDKLTSVLALWGNYLRTSGYPCLWNVFQIPERHDCGYRYSKPGLPSPMVVYSYKHSTASEYVLLDIGM